MKQETYTNKQAILKKEDWKEPKLEVLSMDETAGKINTQTEDYTVGQNYGGS